MRDPQPENITGQKRHTFSWDVSVDVGHLVLGLALLALAVKVAPLFASEPDTDDESEASEYV